MVFENLTLFELHLENSRFGPSFGGETEESESDESIEAATEADEDGGSGSRMRPLGVLLLFVVMAVAARRFRSRGGAEEDIEEESEQITIEHATEQ